MTWDLGAKICSYSFNTINNRCRGRVVRAHLDHVWSCGVREVMSSNPDRGNIVGWVFHPTRWLVRFSLIWINKCLSFQILNLFRTCPRGEALIIGHLHLSSNEVACHFGHYYQWYGLCVRNKHCDHALIKWTPSLHSVIVSHLQMML